MEMGSIIGSKMAENPLGLSGGQQVFQTGIQEAIPVVCPRWTISDAPVTAEWKWAWEDIRLREAHSGDRDIKLSPTLGLYSLVELKWISEEN